MKALEGTSGGRVGKLTSSFGYHQRGRLHHLSVQPVPGLGHPHSKKVLWHVYTELLVFHFVPLCPVLDTTEKTLVTIF